MLLYYLIHISIIILKKKNKEESFNYLNSRYNEHYKYTLGAFIVTLYETVTREILEID